MTNAAFFVYNKTLNSLTIALPRLFKDISCPYNSDSNYVSVILFLTFMPVLDKSGLEITNFPFSSQFDNVFLSKMTIKFRFFKNNF